uniref:Uncharacterized protein n=1 Tax=Plectus sambesii TaxID=2011161 RepID=A0A914WAU4_9BILA
MPPLLPSLALHSFTPLDAKPRAPGRRSKLYGAQKQPLARSLALTEQWLAMAEYIDGRSSRGRKRPAPRGVEVDAADDANDVVWTEDGRSKRSSRTRCANLICRPSRARPNGASLALTSNLANLQVDDYDDDDDVHRFRTTLPYSAVGQPLPMRARKMVSATLCVCCSSSRAMHTLSHKSNNAFESRLAG